MKIKVTREYTLDERMVKEYMKEHHISGAEDKNDFYQRLAKAEVYLLEKLSVYKSNIRNIVEKKNEGGEYEIIADSQLLIGAPQENGN